MAGFAYNKIFKYIQAIPLNNVITPFFFEYEYTQGKIRGDYFGGGIYKRAFK